MRVRELPEVPAEPQAVPGEVIVKTRSGVAPQSVLPAATLVPLGLRSSDGEPPHLEGEFEPGSAFAELVASGPRVALEPVGGVGEIEVALQRLDRERAVLALDPDALLPVLLGGSQGLFYAAGRSGGVRYGSSRDRPAPHGAAAARSGARPAAMSGIASTSRRRSASCGSRQPPRLEVDVASQVQRFRRTGRKRPARGSLSAVDGRGRKSRWRRADRAARSTARSIRSRDPWRSCCSRASRPIRACNTHNRTSGCGRIAPKPAKKASRPSRR